MSPGRPEDDRRGASTAQPGSGPAVGADRVPYTGHGRRQTFSACVPQQLVPAVFTQNAPGPNEAHSALLVHWPHARPGVSAQPHRVSPSVVVEHAQSGLSLQLMPGSTHESSPAAHVPAGVAWQEPATHA